MCESIKNWWTYLLYPLSFISLHFYPVYQPTVNQLTSSLVLSFSFFLWKNMYPWIFIHYSIPCTLHFQFNSVLFIQYYLHQLRIWRNGRWRWLIWTRRGHFFRWRILLAETELTDELFRMRLTMTFFNFVLYLSWKLIVSLATGTRIASQNWRNDESIICISLL